MTFSGVSDWGYRTGGHLLAVEAMGAITGRRRWAARAARVGACARRAIHGDAVGGPQVAVDNGVDQGGIGIAASHFSAGSWLATRGERRWARSSMTSSI